MVEHVLGQAGVLGDAEQVPVCWVTPNRYLSHAP